jgi:hypothetical protein
MRHITFLTLLVVILSTGFTLYAQSDEVQKAGEGIFKPILTLIIKWIIPLIAVMAILYGAAVGFRGGNWLEAIIIILFGLSLAFVQPLLQQLFNIKL